MKHLAAAGVIALGVCAGAAGVAGVAGAAGAPPPRAALRGFVCQRALDPAARAVSVQAVMRPLPGTKKLALRFQLLRRRTSGSFTLVRAGDLGTWITPNNPTLGRLPGDVWEFTKPIVNLVVAPAAYRFKVTFRWTGAHGRVLGTAVRFSRICWQPELRPDLFVQSITVLPISGKPTKDAYVALIRNAGATGAGPFEVVFSPPDASALKTRIVQMLGPHKALRETFVGPLCTGTSAPTVIVDPAGLIDDYNRSNNSLTATCPASSVP
jgi:hypothetical protein